MIIENTAIEIETSDQFEELEYGIRSADMGIVLDILRSRMYENPIAAICREVACNARDANREVGKGNIPITISILKTPIFPSSSCISFKDGGPGISPNRMGGIFINYGASTKRGTNEQTGAFGLGAKTPFSYCDSFSIITVVDGVSYTYVAAIEDNKRGKMCLLSSKKTEEGNGTEIIIPIKNEDREKFEYECYESTKWWDTLPVYANFRSTNSIIHNTSPEYLSSIRLFDSTTASVFMNNCVVNAHGILMDGIFYEADEAINEILDKTRFYVTNCRSYRSSRIMLKCGIGDVSISATREKLHQDQKTLDWINLKIKDLKKEINEHILDIVGVPKSLKDCLTSLDILRYKKNNEFFRRFIRNIDALPCSTWDGEQIPPSLCNNFNTLSFYIITKKDGKIQKSQASDFCSDYYDKACYYNDTTIAMPKARFETILAEKNALLMISPKYDFISGKLSPKNDVEQAAFNRYNSDMAKLKKSGIVLNYLSTVKPTSKKRVAKNSVTKQIKHRLPVTFYGFDSEDNINSKDISNNYFKTYLVSSTLNQNLTLTKVSDGAIFDDVFFIKIKNSRQITFENFDKELVIFFLMSKFIKRKCVLVFSLESKLRHLGGKAIDFKNYVDNYSEYIQRKTGLYCFLNKYGNFLKLFKTIFDNKRIKTRLDRLEKIAPRYEAIPNPGKLYRLKLESNKDGNVNYLIKFIKNRYPKLEMDTLPYKLNNEAEYVKAVDIYEMFKKGDLHVKS